MTVREEILEGVELNEFKSGLGLTPDFFSCHTTIIDGYFVEGHIPADVLARLLQERPDIDGISLPGMPAGSPGMGGAKDGTWLIYSLTGGVVAEYEQY